MKEKCHNCEQLTEMDDLNEVDGLFYCMDCLNDLFFVCNDCEEFYLHDKSHKIEGQIVVCDSCFYDNYHTCDSCGWISHFDSGNIHYYEAFDGCLCLDCYPEYFFYCEMCDQDTLNTTGTYEVDGIWVCEICYRERMIQDKGLLPTLRDFIEFERESPLPLKTLRIWVVGLLNKKFICPCNKALHRCGQPSCPRDLKSCKGNIIYALLDKNTRKFVRWYLLRHLIAMISEQEARFLTFDDLMIDSLGNWN